MYGCCGTAADTCTCNFPPFSPLKSISYSFFQIPCTFTRVLTPKALVSAELRPHLTPRWAPRPDAPPAGLRNWIVLHPKALPQTLSLEQLNILVGLCTGFSAVSATSCCSASQQQHIEAPDNFVFRCCVRLRPNSLKRAIPAPAKGPCEGAFCLWAAASAGLASEPSLLPS